MIDNMTNQDRHRRYEVVCSCSYLDVGLLIETDHNSKPTRVLARATTYGSDAEYGGAELLKWVKTGIFLTKTEWIKITCNMATDDILRNLGIDKKREVKSKAMTNFDKIKEMSIDELAKYFSNGFPTSPCYLCQHDEGFICVSPIRCTSEYRIRVYKEWLERDN